MKLPRPYIPLAVRLKVAERQLGRSWEIIGQSRTERLRLMLALIFPNGEAFDLDHDPPLMLRQKLYHNGKHVTYSPPANDPDFLIYRKKSDHKIKTLVRGDGAQRSDFAQRRYLKRAARQPKKKFKPRRAKQIRRIVCCTHPSK